MRPGPATTAGNPVELIGLDKSYGSVRAVDHLDLTVFAGEMVALLGPDGSGKSTVVELLLGLVRADAGSALIFGLPPGDAVRAGLVGAMLEHGALLDDTTVEETVQMVASLHRGRIPVHCALLRAGIVELARHRVRGLTAGQRQQVHHATALVGDPALLVLDEPTAAMGRAGRAEFWSSVRRFCAPDRTVVFTTGNLNETELADRVVFLKAGQLLADTTQPQARALAGSRTVRAIIPGAIVPDVAALPAVTGVDIDSGRVRVQSSDVDTTLRALLSRYPHARAIEIVRATLDDVLVALVAARDDRRS